MVQFIDALNDALAALPPSTTGISSTVALDGDGNAVKAGVVSFSPLNYLAVGDGVADDTAALNATIDAVRSLISSNRVKAKIDLGGGTYRVTGNGINMSGIQCWNLEVCNGVILGNTTGKPVIDLTGSRGYIWRNVLVFGDATNMPTIPFLCARGTLAADAFCDNNLFDNVTTIGYWSVAAFYEYAQETTRHSHCRYWNYNHDAYVAIFEGIDAHPQTSSFKTVITGAASHINDQYDNIDFRYQASGKTATITGITKANPAVVTCAGGHPFANGQKVAMWLINGMTQMNGIGAVIANVTGTTFELTGINSTGWGTFTSGTAVQMATKPAIYMNRMEQHHFRTCYVATWADHAIEIGITDTRPFHENIMDFLYEGVQTLSEVRFLVGTSVRTVRDTIFKAYNTHASTSFFSTDAGVGGQVSFYGGEIKVTSHTTNTSLPLVDTPAKYAFIAGANILYPQRAGLTPTTYSPPVRSFLSAVDDGEIHIYGAKYKETTDGSFAPTVVSAVGTITTLGTVSAVVRYLGDLVWVEYQILITDNGTGSDHITATLPVQAATVSRAVLVGRETVSGQELQGLIPSNSLVVQIRMDDNNYPGATGSTLYLSGWYRRA